MTFSPAADTIKRFLQDTNTKPNDYDKIFTGDLGCGCSASVLATLYNIGEMGSNNTGPHPNPGSNEFGRFASDHRQLLQCLL